MRAEFVFGFAILLATLQRACAEDSLLSPEALVAANLSAIELVNSFDVTVKLYPYSPSEDGPLGVPNSIWRWSKQGPLERIRYTLHTVPPASDGRPENIADIFGDQDNWRYLANWDWDAPQRIAPTDQGTVKAFISPRTAQVPGSVDPALLFGFKFRLNALDVSRPLDELLGASPKVEQLGRTSIEGETLWGLRVHHPDDRFGGSCFVVYFDPSVNFHIRRFENHGFASKPGGGEEPYEIVYSIVKFHGFGDGVFFPAQVNIAGVEGAVARNVVNDVVVNGPLPAEAFDFRFPEGVLVRHEPAKLGKRKVELWGANDAPLATIESGDDLRRFATPPASSGWRPFFWANVVVAILAAALVAYRYRRRLVGE